MTAVSRPCQTDDVLLGTVEPRLPFDGGRQPWALNAHIRTNFLNLVQFIRDPLLMMNQTRDV